jgi:hypothetical protein
LTLDGLRRLTTASRLARNRWRRLRAPLGLTLDGLDGLRGLTSASRLTKNR